MNRFNNLILRYKLVTKITNQTQRQCVYSIGYVTNAVYIKAGVIILNKENIKIALKT